MEKLIKNSDYRYRRHYFRYSYTQESIKKARCKPGLFNSNGAIP
ncbi:hypothetical protein [Pontibacter sp. HSC-14F20]|nr:hypothetical protein [Pontibacter sp. HSC-14F20]